MKVTGTETEVIIEDGNGRKIKVTMHQDGIVVKNVSEGSTCIYKKTGDRDTLMFSDAHPKGSWKEFESLVL